MLGIVILNYKSYEKTIDCVESILATHNDEIAIYIVDNDSPNESHKILTEKYNSNSSIKIIKSNQNEGFAKGNNIGLNECLKDGCEYVILSNNDILFCEESIYELYIFIKNKKSSIIVGPKIYHPNMKIQHSSTLKKVSFVEYLGLGRLIPIKLKKLTVDEERIDHAVKVYSVSGCCFIVNLKLFKQVGAFDEGTFLFNEENILSLQASQSGYTTYFLPSAKVIHAHGATTGRENMFVNGEFLKSGFYYWKKYRKVNNLFLVLMWLNFTLRWFLKSLYCKDLRSGWSKYLRKTWNSMKKEMVTKY